MDVFDQNTVVPVVVIIACIVAALLTHLFTREKPRSISLPRDDRGRRTGGNRRDPGAIQPGTTDTRRAVPPAYRPPGGPATNGAGPGFVTPTTPVSQPGAAQTGPLGAAGSQPHGATPGGSAQSPVMALETWHRHYGASVHAWIRNHEALLDEITDGGLEIQAVSPELTQRHEQLAPIIRDAIEAHPAPEMRAQLSAMIVSSQATLHSLHRRQYDSAEHQHLTYLDYRDSWLHRLRQFETSDENSRELWDLADQQRPTPGWS